MNKYIIIRQGEQEGCDYTIGCNINFTIEKFDGNFEEAKQHFIFKEFYPEGEEEPYFTEDLENELSELWVIPFDENYKIDLESTKKGYRKKEEEKITKDVKIAELRELKRLKSKYE